MTKTEARRLRVGSKFLYKSPLGYETTRTIKFIAWNNRKPAVIFYGASWGKRIEYEKLLLDKYILIKR